MMKSISVLLLVFVMLCGCIEIWENTIGESIRNEVFVDKKWGDLKEEIIIEPEETLYARVNVTEGSGYRFRGGSGIYANLTLRFHHPNNRVEEIASLSGTTDIEPRGWFVAPYSPIQGTGTFEVSITNHGDKPAYLWYTLYVHPRSVDPFKHGGVDEVTSSEVTYLTFQRE